MLSEVFSMATQSPELEHLHRSCKQFFADTLAVSDLSQLCSNSQRIEVAPQQEFWNSITGKPGLYIVVAGRVRLIDRDRNLLTTLEPEQTFGELTLFSEATFDPYSIRSTQEGVTLYYLPTDVITPFLEQYPNSRNILYKTAKQKYTSSEVPSNPSTSIITATQTNSHRPVPHVQKQNSPSSSTKSTSYWPSPTVKVGHL
jgi:CRP-like cAMP-binding protein